jgi:hypothetical protein
VLSDKDTVLGLGEDSSDYADCASYFDADACVQVKSRFWAFSVKQSMLLSASNIQEYTIELNLMTLGSAVSTNCFSCLILNTARDTFGDGF